MTSYDAILYQVGGEIELTDISKEATRIEWFRKMDGFDQATVSFNPAGADCCGMIPYVRPYLHEVHLNRDGKTVFDGPVTVGPSGEKPDIVGGGMTDWFDARMVRTAIDHSALAVAASQVVDELVRSAMTPVDPNLLPFLEIIYTSTPSDRKSSITPAVHEMLWGDHLEALVGSVVHMSTLGRQVSFWPSKTGLRHMGTLSDQDFVTTAPLFRDGRNFATAASVWNGDGSAPAAGYAGGVHPAWQILVERSLRDTKITAATAGFAAAKMVSADVPLRSSTEESFRLEFSCHTLTQVHLVQPGNTFDLELSQGCLPFSATMQVIQVGDVFQNGQSKPYIVVKELV